ncbi:hypothetical protein [Micromonospora sp. NPDC023814]|uniref:hypothetical protein n=1 Tax=Micromonospora sp. NPDC023814 TaxID=3154596 RepID=UPI0033EFEF7F
MEEQLDPLVNRWHDLVRPRVIRSHRRAKGRHRTVAVAALVLATVTSGAVVSEGWPDGPIRPPLRGAPPPVGAIADSLATTAAGQGAQAGPTATPPSAAASPPPRTPTSSPTPSRLPRPSLPPTSTSEPTTGPGRGAASTPPRTTSPPPAVFVPLRIEAEAPTNVVSGGATAVPCGPCSGGTRVGYIDAAASVVVIADLPTSGQRTVRVTYETDGPRQIKIKANGVQVDTRWLDGDGWESPRSFTFTAMLPAGPLRLAFYNDQSPSPDIDQVTIS